MFSIYTDGQLRIPDLRTLLHQQSTALQNKQHTVVARCWHRHALEMECLNSPPAYSANTKISVPDVAGEL